MVRADQTALELLNEAERVVMRLKSGASFEAGYVEDDECTDLEGDAWHRAREDARMARLEPRALAAADLRANLQEVWKAGLETLVYRHVPDAESYARSCIVRSGLVILGPGVLAMCRWGCDRCCNRVLGELKKVRDGEAAAVTLREIVKSVREDAPDVRDDEILATEVRERFGIPSSTLHDWISGDKVKSPRKTERGERVLNRAEVEALVADRDRKNATKTTCRRQADKAAERKRR